MSAAPPIPSSSKNSTADSVPTLSTVGTGRSHSGVGGKRKRGLTEDEAGEMVASQYAVATAINRLAEALENQSKVSNCLSNVFV